MKSRIIEFLTLNGWLKIEENEEFQSFAREGNIGVDVSDKEVVLIGESGDFMSIEIGQHALYQLLGYMIQNHFIAINYKWPNPPEKKSLR